MAITVAESALDGGALLKIQPATEYNEAERRYSVLLNQRLEDLMKGKRNSLLLLRRYHDEPTRLGTMSTPADLDRSSLHIRTVEKMAVEMMLFLAEDSPGGPATQRVEADGRIVETRQFPTRHPHIVIDRVDTYSGETKAPQWSEWRARRVQNQYSNTLINRLFDAANLALELSRHFPR